MTAVAESTAVVPQGKWLIDPVHSTATFAIKHMVVATFRGSFDKIDAELDATGDEPRLVGTVKVDSIQVRDENLLGHLKSPEFFDVERYPEIRFESRAIRRDGEELVVDGELTVKGHTNVAEARGTITDPHVTLGDAEKGITLETVIDRTAYGLDWNAELPKGGYALGNDVKLVVELELVRQEA